MYPVSEAFLEALKQVQENIARPAGERCWNKRRDLDLNLFAGDSNLVLKKRIPKER